MKMKKEDDSCVRNIGTSFTRVKMGSSVVCFHVNLSGLPSWISFYHRSIGPRIHEGGEKAVEIPVG